ncbi:MAG TPA: lytic transglycosylase domain-containing protein [Bryobacteraceae bacterium]|nr:lytic transglycosylase domain-containing protein [Bryobacteraceae bacterium]
MPALASPPEPIAPLARSVVRADSRTGRLVRETVAPKSAAGPADRARMAGIIDKVAAEQGVDGPLVHSVARAESNYNPLAISSKGAQGIMQLEPETARRFGVSNAFDPEQNVRGGVKYLKFLLNYYRGDYTKAVAAYNAGEKAVDRYQGIPPYAETRDYVVRVSRNLKSAREKAKKDPVPDTAAPAAETYRPIQTSVGSDGRIYYRTP